MGPFSCLDEVHGFEYERPREGIALWPLAGDFRARELHRKLRGSLELQDLDPSTFAFAETLREVSSSGRLAGGFHTAKVPRKPGDASVLAETAELNDEALEGANGGYLYGNGFTTDVIDDTTGEVVKTFAWDASLKEMFDYCEAHGLAPQGTDDQELAALRASNGK